MSPGSSRKPERDREVGHRPDRVRRSGAGGPAVAWAENHGTVSPESKEPGPGVGGPEAQRRGARCQGKLRAKEDQGRKPDTNPTACPSLEPGPRLSPAMEPGTVSPRPKGPKVNHRGSMGPTEIAEPRGIEIGGRAPSDLMTQFGAGTPALACAGPGTVNRSRSNRGPSVQGQGPASGIEGQIEDPTPGGKDTGGTQDRHTPRTGSRITGQGTGTRHR